MKKRFVKLSVVLLTAVCLIAACFALPRVALSPVLAEESAPLSAELICGNGDVTYKHIAQITAFDAFDALYFSDGENIYNDSEIAEEAGAAASAVFEDKLIYAKIDGGIYYKDDCLTDGEFTALALLEQTLYAAQGDKVIVFAVDYNQAADAVTLAQTDSFDCAGEIQDLCASGEAVYYKLKNQTGIYTIRGEVNGFLRSVENLKALSASPDYLYCLTNTQIISYLDKSGMLTRQESLDFTGEFIAAGEEHVYAASKDGETFTIHRTDHALTQIAPFLASRGSYDYFYRAPCGVSSRFGEIFVADTNNNRVSAISDTGVTPYEFYIQDGEKEYYDEPKSAALSINGNLYVAHQNKLTNNTTGRTLELKDAKGLPLIIQKILIDSSGNVYAFARQPLSAVTYAYSIEADLPSFPLNPLTIVNDPSAIGVKMGGDVLFLDGSSAEGNSIKNLKGETVTTVPALKDFCMDFSGKIFGINMSGNLVSISGGITTNHGGSYNTLSLSNIACGLIGFGDILLIETATNSLKRISAQDAGVADMAAQFPAPDAANDNTAHIKTDSFVAAVKFDAPLFAQATEATTVCTLPKDSDVFIRRDIDAPQDMYFAAAEYRDAEGTRMVYGYVYKSALHPPYPYVSPQKNTGRVVIDTGIHGFIYKYPSLYAQPVKTVKNGDAVNLLPFAANKSLPTFGDWYADIDGKKWVRVEIGNNEGYMLPEQGLSWSLFSDSGSQPNANATIKEDAFLYAYDAQNNRYYILFDEAYSFLKKGTRVEIPTPHDTSKSYTRVIFSIVNENGETMVIGIECYVETKYIDSDAPDILQIVAIAGIIIAVVLIIFLAVWLSKRRKRRMYAGFEKQ